MREKDDESRFFTEVSDRSKDHQETDKKEANDVAQDARNTLNSLQVGNDWARASDLITVESGNVGGLPN